MARCRGSAEDSPSRRGAVGRGWTAVSERGLDGRASRMTSSDEVGPIPGSKTSGLATGRCTLGMVARGTPLSELSFAPEPTVTMSCLMGIRSMGSVARRARRTKRGFLWGEEAASYGGGRF